MDECRQPDTICLYHDYWFWARVTAVLSGQVDDESMKVATTSHDGMQSFIEDDSPRLMSLLLHGGDVVMPKYASRSLATRSDGALFLIDNGVPLPDWLPCAATTLREPLDEQAFSPALRISPDSYEARHVDLHRDLFRITPDGAFPRYGIAVTRLRDLFASLTASGASTSCPRP